MPLSHNLAFAEKHAGFMLAARFSSLAELELLSLHYYTHDAEWFAFINTKLHLAL